MRTIDSDNFPDLLQQAHIKPRLSRELRFGQSIANIPKEDWPYIELVGISNRSSNEGVLLIELNGKLFITPYSILKGITDKQTGRSKPIICDFCSTWQAGGNAATISFTSQKTRHSLSFLCCADLACSQHVRTKTNEALLSRSQLHEDLTNEQRAGRLKTKLRGLINKLSGDIP